MPCTSMPPPPTPLSHRRTRVNLSYPLSPPCSPDSLCSPRKMSLSKGATFHEASLPSTDDDPVLSIRHLARRSPTAPRSHLQSILDKEDAARDVIQSFDHTFSGARGNRLSSHLSDAEQQLKTYKANTSPLDEGLGSSITHSTDKGLTRSFDRVPRRISDKDSGLGSSIQDSSSVKDVDHQLTRAAEEDGLVQDLIQGTNPSDSAPVQSRLQEGSIKRASSSTRSAITQSISPPTQNNQRPHRLSRFAKKKFEQNILQPILREDRFNIFHPLVEAIGSQTNKSIRCLRDLERTLLFESYKTDRPLTHHLYRAFGEFSIQLVLDTYQYLSEADQRRAADRPYNSGYFLDLVQQVGSLAAQIRRDRESREVGTAADVDDMYSPDDEVTLEGGLGQDGNIAELVRWKDGKGTSLRTNEPYIPLQGLKRRSSTDSIDEDADRSMARRKKNAPPKKLRIPCPSCNVISERQCDFTKHMKSHTRPYKCQEKDCKYHELGLPTEKELERHFNDKHSSNPKYFSCLFPGCTFKTKRESNCKQHMEKKHDWNYERAKGNGKKPKSTPGATPKTPNMDYPSSEQSPAGSNYYQDGSSVYGESVIGTPFEQPLGTPFEPSMPTPYDQAMDMTYDPPQTLPYRAPSGMPLFPRPDQERRQFVRARNDFGFETNMPQPVYNAGYPPNVPHVNTQTSPPQVMGTPMTPAYSAFSYEPSPQAMSITMDFQGANLQWDGTGLPTPNSNYLLPHSRNPSLSYESPVTGPDQSMVGMNGELVHDPMISQSQLPVESDFMADPPVFFGDAYHSHALQAGLFDSMDQQQDDYVTEFDQFIET